MISNPTIRFSSCWLSFQHPLAYINIDSTLLLNRRNFKRSEYLLLLQIAISLLKMPDNCPIILLISSVTSPVFSIQLPKNLNSRTCSTVLSEHWRARESQMWKCFLICRHWSTIWPLGLFMRFHQIATVINLWRLLSVPYHLQSQDLYVAWFQILNF